MMEKRHNGKIIYSMPLEKYHKMRSSLLFLYFICSICLIIMITITISELIEKNIIAGLYTFGIELGALLLLFFISSPYTIHNPLIIFENAVIPLSRPFLSQKNKILSIEDIVQIDFDGWKGDENLIYTFSIQDINNKRYKINSLVLSKYEKSEKKIILVHDALLNLKKKIDLRKSQRDEQYE